MKTIKKVALLAFAIPMFFTSCSDDDNGGGHTSKGEFDNGTFVLNEGGSSLSTASISFIGNDGTIEQDIFRAVNPEADEIGTYLQNIFFDDTRAFIVSGSTNQITVVNRYSFEYITTITNFSAPRYGVVYNGKAYVTNANDFSGTTGFVTVINLSDYSTSTIELNKAAERILEENGKIYVSNGAFGTGNSITVINPNTDTIETTIELDESPSTFDEENGTLYVLGNSKIFKINTSNNQVSSSVAIPSSLTFVGNLTIENQKIYFTGNGSSVYSLGLNSSEISETPILVSDVGFLYGFAVNDGKIYISDGGDFSSDSKVYIYSTSGTFMNSYEVGVAPNGFYFND